MSTPPGEAPPEPTRRIPPQHRRRATAARPQNREGYQHFYNALIISLSVVCMSGIESINERKRRRYVERLVESGFKSPKNRAMFKMFLGYLRQSGLKVASIYHYGRALELLDGFLAGRPFDEVTKQDLKNFFNDMAERYDPGTIDNMKTYIKRFYKWLLGEDEEYPDLVKWIKKSNHRRQRVERSDLITYEEFERMLGKCDNFRDRALLWLLYETGIRVGELISIRIRDVEIKENMGVITVRGKTGSRAVPLIAGLPDLQAWIERHPFKDEPDAPLFISYKRGSFGKPLLESGVYNIVYQLAKRAGLKKRIHPHLFRHTRATQLSTKLRESVLKQLFGWSQSSRVPQVYLHLASSDVINSYSELYGFKAEEKLEEKFKPRQCPRCAAMNPFDAIYCVKCGLVLDEKVAAERLRREEELIRRLEELERRYAANELLRLMALENKLLNIAYLGKEALNADQRQALERELKYIRAEIERLKSRVSEEEFEKIQEMADRLS